MLRVHVRQLHQTGLDGTTLYLYFKNATGIEAGKPYLIKWTSGDNIVSPVFSSVTIDDTNRNMAFTGGSFIGNYTPVTLPAGSSNYYLGTENKLYYPSANRTMNAFRAYFHLNSSPNYVKSIKLNFGETTSLREIRNEKGEMRNGAWYTLDGRKLQKKPTQKGIYIYNGRKIVIK